MALVTKSQLEKDAWRNVIINVTGESKSGKTHLALRSDGPRYIAYFDRNTALPAALLSASNDGFAIEGVYVEDIEATPYDKLTRAIAEEAVMRVQSLADFAISEAATLRSKGQHGGTFIIDGALLMKGYIEKWKLGESATLGYRAKSGQRGVSPLQYGETNTWFNDFVSQFASKNLDVILTWEGRRVWEQVWEDGRKSSRPTPRFKSSGPERMSYVINAEVTTIATDEVVIRDNVPTDQTRVKHRVQIGYNAFNSNLRGRIVKVDSFKELKELFLDGISDVQNVEPQPEVVEVLDGN